MIAEKVNQSVIQLSAGDGGASRHPPPLWAMFSAHTGPFRAMPAAVRAFAKVPVFAEPQP